MKRIVEGVNGGTQGAPADPGFARAVVDWQRSHGRHDLPWQNTRDAYHVWLSEIMLQQTQVAAVIPYYQRFLARFPDLSSLAAASQEEVMAHWSGLGYYSRARNLHRCAQQVCQDFGGVFPADPEALAELPGIGRSTAAAIAAFSHGARAAILDGNVKRVLCRVFGVDGYPGSSAVEQQLWRRAEALLPRQNLEAYTQGLMDLGATVCTRSRPACGVCPLASRCVALASGRVAELPQRKPRKAIPQRRIGMLVIADSDQVLLELRPGAGIWGGLWSLPELAADDDGTLAPDSIALAVERFGAMASCQGLEPFTHTFTHFRLQVAPWRVTLAQRRQLVGETGHAWHAWSSLEQAALPAPVKKLLLGLAPV